MGADNLRSFHRWQRWRDIARLVPIAVVDRLGPSLYASAGVAGQALAYARLPEIGGADAAGTKAAGLDLPAWAQIAAFLDRAAGGTGLARQLTASAVIDCNKMTARQLKLLTARAYLSDRFRIRWPGPKMERKDKDPCPHL